MVLRRSRLVRVLVAIALVALAAVGLRLSEGRRRGLRGRARRASASRWRSTTGTVTASDVRVGTSLSRDDEVYAVTPGLFVVVRRARSRPPGRRDCRGYNAQRAHRPASYEAFGAAGAGNEPPGFATGADLVFEVDPAMIADLTLELAPSELITGVRRSTPGSTSASPPRTPSQWRAAARDQVVGAARADEPGDLSCATRGRLPIRTVLVTVAVGCLVLLYVLWWTTYARHPLRRAVHPAAARRGRPGRRHQRSGCCH